MDHEHPCRLVKHYRRIIGDMLLPQPMNYMSANTLEQLLGQATNRPEV
jgi:hypothetical protein